MSHWSLVDSAGDASSPIVIEAHTDTISIQLSDLLTILANELSQSLTAIGNYVNGARRSLECERPDQDMARIAVALAADQIVRSTEQVKMLRSMARDLHPLR